MSQPANINFRQRLTQAMVLAIIILAGILFSLPADAQSIFRPRHHNHKSKRQAAIHTNGDRTCYVLHKKRTAMPKHPLFASSRRGKFKPLAETDAPSSKLITSN